VLIRGIGAWAVLTFALACGPIEYVSQVTKRATTKLEDAKKVEADKLAPYEYTLAVEYLHKAREEASFADYQAANRFGRLAEEAAIEAATLAAARAADPERRARELPPSNIPGQSGETFAPLDAPEPKKDPDPTGEKESPPDLEDKP